MFIFIILLFFIRVQCNMHKDNSCEDKIIKNITKNYFYDRNCITIIKLCENNPDILYIQYNIPTLVQSLDINKYKPNFNLTTRPRRDYFDKKRIINSLCSETGHGYLVIVKTMTDIMNYIHFEIITPFWSPQAYIFIYFTEEICDDNAINVFKTLWRLYKTPYVIISGSKCKNILFYNPFILDNKEYGKFYNFHKQQIAFNADLLQNKMKTFNGYPLKAMIFKSPYSIPINNKEYIGLNVNLAILIANSVNFSLKLILPSDDEQYGYLLPNGTYTGAIGVLLTGEIDYISVDYFIKDYLTFDIEFSSSISTDYLCVIMRKAEKIPDWKLLYFCLDEITWICIIVIYFIIALNWIALQYILTQFKEDAKVYPFVFIDTLRLMITSSLFRLPTITSERLFLAFCLMAFITLVGAFQGSLFRVYSSLMFYKDIETLKELSTTDTQIKTKYKFFIEDVFSDETYPIIAKLKRMTSFYDDSVSITERVVNQKNFATLVRQSEAEIDNTTATYIDENGVNLIHMIKECPRIYSLANILPINSAFSSVINKILLRSAQAGLPVKWYNEMVFNISESASRRNSRSDALKIFSLNDMQISFFQLLIGMIAGTLSFIAEVCIYLLNKHKFPEYLTTQ